MSDREIHINNDKYKNVTIDYIHDVDSSDNNENDNTNEFRLLVNNKKIMEQSNDSNDIDLNINQQMKTNIDNIMTNNINKKSQKSSKHSNSSYKKDTHKFKGKNTLLSSGSSLSDADFKHNMKSENLEDIMKNKQYILLDIDKFKQLGYKFTRDYNISSNYEEMKSELNRVKMVHNNKKGIKFCRNALMTLCSGVEQLSGFTSIGELDGWSEDVNMNIESYDDVFEELYQKYGSYADVLGPELKLVFMLVQSAFLYHMMRKMTGPTMKNFENIINNNSDNTESKVSNGGGNPLGDLLGNLMGGNKGGGGIGDLMSGGLGKFMGMNLGGNNNKQQTEYQGPNITETPIINKTPVKQADYVIKSPELAGLETLLDDLSGTSKSTARKNKSGKRVLSLN